MYTRKLRAITGSFIAVLVLVPTLGTQTAPSRQPIARMGDQTIYEEELLPLIQGQLLQLKKQEYEIRIKALDDVLNQRLLELEARSEALSVAALLRRVDDDLPPWNIKEVEGYYLAQRDRFNKPLDAVRTEVERAFLEAKRQQGRQAYIERLRQKAGIVILLNPPGAELAVDPSRLRGDPDALVSIVEFGDFQCPYSQSSQPILKQVMEKYKGKVRLAFRDFPLRAIHSQAQPAAEASRCAGEQGNFWEYHELLFAHETDLGPDTYMQLARSAGLDSRRFEACLASGKFRPLIESDVQSGAALGVAGTPAFFINGILLSGWQPALAFEKIIDSELAKQPSR